MNEIENAIYTLKHNGFVENTTGMTHAEVVDLAISALEKQISVSRIIKEGKYYCPKCDLEMKKCGSCKHKEKLLFEDFLCTNEKSEYNGEFVTKDFVCRGWEGKKEND